MFQGFTTEYINLKYLPLCLFEELNVKKSLNLITIYCKLQGEKVNN